MAKEKISPNHHMGNATGYELIDGEYHIAPVYQLAFRELAEKRIAIEELLQIVSKHAIADLEQIVKAKDKLWDRISGDVGLDCNVQWEYRDGIIKKSEKKPEPEKIVKGEQNDRLASNN